MILWLIACYAHSLAFLKEDVFIGCQSTSVGEQRLISCPGGVGLSYLRTNQVLSPTGIALALADLQYRALQEGGLYQNSQLSLKGQHWPGAIVHFPTKELRRIIVAQNDHTLILECTAPLPWEAYCGLRMQTLYDLSGDAHHDHGNDHAPALLP